MLSLCVMMHALLMFMELIELLLCRDRRAMRFFIEVDLGG